MRLASRAPSRSFSIGAFAGEPRQLRVAGDGDDDHNVRRRQPHGAGPASAGQADEQDTNASKRRHQWRAGKLPRSWQCPPDSAVARLTCLCVYRLGVSQRSLGDMPQVLNQFEQMVECTQLLQLLPFSDDPVIISVLPVREPSQLPTTQGGVSCLTPSCKHRVRTQCLVKVGIQSLIVRNRRGFVSTLGVLEHRSAHRERGQNPASSACAFVVACVVVWWPHRSRRASSRQARLMSELEQQPCAHGVGRRVVGWAAHAEGEGQGRRIRHTLPIRAARLHPDGRAGVDARHPRGGPQRW
jgi:hypothetical protein